MKLKVVMEGSYIFGQLWIYSPLSTTPISWKFGSTGKKGLVMWNILHGFVSKAKWCHRKCRVKNNAQTSKQPKQSGKKRSLGKFVTSPWLNHHSRPLCSLGSSLWELVDGLPVSEFQSPVCTWPCVTSWTTPICQVWPLHFPADVQILFCFYSLFVPRLPTPPQKSDAPFWAGRELVDLRVPYLHFTFGKSKVEMPRKWQN